MTITLDMLRGPIAQYYICAVLLVYPVLRILRRAGFRPYWALLLAVPDAGLILCAVAMALQKWKPREGGAA